jgi:pimeloyl-ACP methyl ester carboxylesterase
MNHFTAADGTKLHYDDRGEGLPLLCLSGLTRTMGDFQYLMPHLPKCRLIRMDYRGRGGSEWSGAATYTVKQEAEDALALLDHLGIDRAAILGTSRGGLIGMYLALIEWDRVLGLCLNDVGPVLEREGLLRIQDYIGRNPAAKTFEALAAALPRFNPGFANVPAERWLAEANLHAREVPGGLAITYDPTLRDSFLASMAAPQADAWPLFEALAGRPVALIRGANSDLLSMKTAKEMRSRRPDMIFANVPDRAHIPFLDEPRSLRAIRAFIRACHD